jgi:asparagine synthase (glutamine-hydrolysing)
MCGIAGVFDADAGRALAAVARMNAAQVHRGPDDEGVAAFEVAGATLAFGHRRLSIIDLSPAGHQPMVHAASGAALVYNGELYNTDSIRRTLEARGERFRGRSDSEVLLSALVTWGIDALRRVDGIFAFAFFDPRSSRLLFARDPLGIKPMYVAFRRGRLAFASELRAIEASGVIEPRVDRGGLASVLAYGAVVGPRTMFSDVTALEPGTCVDVDLRAIAAGEAVDLGARSTRYWDFPRARAIREPDAVVGRALRERVAAAVEAQLVSDVPVGVFLSRGLDSSAIAAFAAAARPGDVDTFTVTLGGDRSLDEGPIAAATARALGTRHHGIVVDEVELPELARRWLRSIDQPTVDGLNTYIVSKAVREQGIVVALSGLGGDEMFGGYSTFREVPPLSAVLGTLDPLPASMRRAVAERLLARRSRAQRQKGGDLAAAGGKLRDVYLARRRVVSDADMEALGFGELAADAYLPAAVDLERGVGPSDPWTSVRSLETRLYMRNVLLRDTDVFGMAHGLEIRVPLLGQPVVDFALTRTRSWLDVMPGSKKRWLVEAVRGLVPDAVHSLPKAGFALPFARWMRGPLRDEMAEGVRALATSGLVDGSAVDAVWNAFLADEDGRMWSRAWTLAITGSWLARRRLSGA